MHEYDNERTHAAVRMKDKYILWMKKKRNEIDRNDYTRVRPSRSCTATTRTTAQQPNRQTDFCCAMMSNDVRLPRSSKEFVIYVVRIRLLFSGGSLCIGICRGLSEKKIHMCEKQ